MKNLWLSKKFLLLIFAILLLVYWQWWIPEPKVANDFPYVSDSSIKSQMDFPRLWSEPISEGLGQYIVFSLWSWPLIFISGVMANLGLDFSSIERILFLIPLLIVGVLGIWKFLESLQISSLARFVASIFYVTNTYIILLIDGGQLSIALAYSWFPISFIFIRNSFQDGWKNKILAGLTTAILGFFDIRFIYLLFIITLLWFLYQLLLSPKDKTSLILNAVKSGFLIAVTVVGLNIYWIIPLLKSPLPQETYEVLTRTSFEKVVSLGHALLMISPHWYENVFGRIPYLRFEFIFIPLIAFAAAVLKLGDRQVGFWLITALFSIFLIKGSSEPFSNIYPWLFSEIPGFSLFRDSTKFFFLLALSYSALIGVSIDQILKRVNSTGKKNLFVFALTLYLLFLIRPVWLGEMTGTLSSPYLKDEYIKSWQVFEADKNFSRVFWIPSFKPLSLADQNHPAVEAAKLVKKRPFEIGTKGTYETFNFLREAPFMGEIFDVAGIGYIAYPYLDPKRDDMHPDNIKYYYTFLDQLSNLPWSSRIDKEGMPILKVKEHQDRFFVTPNIWWIVGSDSIYNEATKSNQLKLSKNSLVFIEERAGLGRKIEEFPEAKVVLNDKHLLDLAASFIEQDRLIFPAKQLSFDPDDSGWWKREGEDVINWRYFLKTKYDIDNQDFDLGGGWAIGEGNLELKVKSEKLRNGVVLVARVMESARGEELRFSQNGEIIGKLDTKNTENRVRWFEIGELVNSGEVVIESFGDINVINALAGIEKDKWRKYQQKAQVLKEQGRIVEFSEEFAEDSPVKVSYEKINSTKYKIQISGLSKPGMLIFSANYNPYWRISSRKEPILVYSLLNGFRVEKNGEYVVTFEPQKYVYPGLVISGLTLLIVISYLIFLKNRNN